MLVQHSPSGTSYDQQSGANYDYCILIRRTCIGLLPPIRNLALVSIFVPWNGNSVLYSDV